MAISQKSFLAIDSDYENTANWTGSTVPVSEANVRIGDTDQDLLVNLNQDAATWTPNTPYNSLLVAETYRGDFGGSGNFFRCNALSAILRPGGQNCWIKGGFGEVVAAPLLMSANALQLDSRDNSADGDIDILYCLQGRTNLVDGATVQKAMMIAGAASAELVINANTVIVGDLVVHSGLVKLHGEVDGTVFAYGGVVETFDTSDMNKCVVDGGNVQWNGGVISGGSAADPSLVVSKGYFDGHKHYDYTTIAAMLALGDMARINLRTGLKNIVRTTSQRFGNPQVTLDDGETF